MRICSECPNSLADKGPQAKTCSDICRSARSRRLKRQKKKAGDASFAHTPEQRDVAQMVRGEAVDLGRELLKEELRPVVREAITEDIFKAISEMVKLTPAAVASLADDIQSDDASLRHRASALVVKYTVGHAALVRPDDADGSKQLVVNFNLPRPGDAPEGLPDAEATAVELRTCDTCAADKPVLDFVANSTRCAECYDRKRLEVMTQFGAA